MVLPQVPYSTQCHKYSPFGKYYVLPEYPVLTFAGKSGMIALPVKFMQRSWAAVIDYAKLYHMMFNAATDAISAIDSSHYGAARALLVKAQQDAEELYIETAPEAPEFLIDLTNDGADNLINLFPDQPER